MTNYITQNSLLLTNLLEFYNRDNNLEKILPIINGESKTSLRLIDWFATNYSKKFFTVYKFKHLDGVERRFKVYLEYKLKLRAYSKKRFDPFCRWDRITIPYKQDSHIQTTIGQLNFFRWILENKILEYIEKNFEEISHDMNKRNSTSKNKKGKKDKTTRKTREDCLFLLQKALKRKMLRLS